MKKLATFILACLTVFSATAGTVPNEFSVVSRFSSGVIAITCRAIFDAYVKEYGGTVVHIVRQGANGVLAVEEVANSDKFTVLCGTTSELIFNLTEYPQHTQAHNQLQVTNIVTHSIVSFSTRPDSKFNSLPELIANKKQITVGASSSSHAFIARKIFPEGSMTFVPFKEPGQSLPSLMDGTLDVYINGGIFEDMHAAGKLKSLGNLHGLPTSVGMPLEKIYSQAAKYPSIVGLAVNKNVPMETVIEFNARIHNVMKTPAVQKVILGFNNTYVPYSVKQATEFVNQMRAEVAKAK